MNIIHMEMALNAQIMLLFHPFWLDPKQTKWV